VPRNRKHKIEVTTRPEILIPWWGGKRFLSTSVLFVSQVLGKLNKDLDKTHRTSKQTVDLLKMEYTTDRSEPKQRS
jgi:hypothetical protein